MEQQNKAFKKHKYIKETVPTSLMDDDYNILDDKKAEVTEETRQKLDEGNNEFFKEFIDLL